MGFTVEDLARTSLVRILPRGRYRLAGQTDSRFQSFASQTIRIAYRQHGATPAFLLFSGPGQDPHAAATAAAAWAEANWRPNAVQRKVRPGVVVVQVAPGAELTKAGPLTGTAIPAAVWTVDSETGRVEVDGSPPGSPSGAEVRRAAEALARGVAAPSLGELDLAERAVMQVRTRGMPPRVVAGAFGICLVFFALRYGLGGVFSLLALPSLVASGGAGSGLYVLALAAINLLMLVGIAIGVALLFNLRNLAYRLPGFSSPEPRIRTFTWGGYIAVMIGLAVGLNGVLPAAERNNIDNAQGQYAHVTATANDDGTETFVAVGGDLSVDLSGWPASEWAGVQFKTSNPSVLSLDTTPPASGPPVAHLTANQVGASRVDATSADGRYTYQLRVTVFNA